MLVLAKYFLAGFYIMLLLLQLLLLVYHLGKIKITYVYLGKIQNNNI